MNALDVLRSMWRHSAWADAEVVRALGDNQEAWREYAHILGAAETWLSRIEQRKPKVPVWPVLSADQALTLGDALTKGYAQLLDGLTDDALQQDVTYTTSDGRVFTNTLGDILTHAALHAQYHRGKVNLLLRQRETAPAPVDFIAYIRGAAAATQASSASSTSPRRNP